MTPPTAEAVGLAAELERLAECEGGVRGGSERAAETMRQSARLLRALSAVPDDGLGSSSPKSEDTHRAPDGWVLVPKDTGPNFSDSTLPLAMIEAGMAVQDQVHHDNTNYVAGETTDWDQGMVAVAIYRAMLQAAPSPSVSTGDAEGTVVAANDRWKTKAILLLEAVREMRRAEDKHVRMARSEDRGRGLDAGDYTTTTRDNCDLWLTRVYDRGTVGGITRMIQAIVTPATPAGSE